MKINNKKIIVSTLALAMGAALAGSISGSVAWYQYSTRTAAVINGVSAGVTGDMAVSVDGSAFAEKATSANTYEFIPISAAVAGTTVSHYTHPVYQTVKSQPVDDAALDSTVNPTGSPADNTVHYYDYELLFRFYESETSTAANADSKAGTAIQDKNVYLTYFDIEGPLAPAVRVEIIPDSSVNANHFFLSDSETAESVVTKGNLDLNNNGKLDTPYWDCSDSQGTPIEYINGTSEGYSTQAHSSVVIPAAAMENPYEFTPASVSGKELALTDGDATSPKTLKIRVWIEGWAKLVNKIKPVNGTNIDGLGYFTDAECTAAASGTANGSTTYYYKSSTWDLDKIGTEQFNINMQFACEANK